MGGNPLPYLWSEADLARLAELRAQGLSQPQIADALGVSFERVRDKLKRIQRLERNAAKKDAAAFEREKATERIKAMALRGVTTTEISRTLGIARQTVQNIIDTLDIPRPEAARVIEPWEKRGITKERFVAGDTPLPAWHPIAAAVLQQARIET